MEDTRKQCRGCVYFSPLATINPHSMKACNYFLATQKRRQVAEDGVTCLSKEPRKEKE